MMGLTLRRKVKKRLPARVKEAIVIPTHYSHTWNIASMSNVLSNGSKFRSFNVMDDFNREILNIEIDYSLKSIRVIWVLNLLNNKHGKPQKKNG
jgi:putative transposase